MGCEPTIRAVTTDGNADRKGYFEVSFHGAVKTRLVL